MAEKKYMFNDVLREPMSDLERMSVGNPGTKEMYASEIREALAQNRDDAKVKIPMRPKKQKPFKMDLEKIKKLINLKKIKDLQDKMGLEKNMAEGGIMRANYARGTDLEAGAQPITIEGDIRPDNMKMASESPEEELEMLRDIELLQEMKEFEDFKKNKPKDPAKGVRKIKLAQGGLSSLLGE